MSKPAFPKFHAAGRRQRAALLSALTLLLPVSRACAEAADERWSDGTLEATCAPYDGPAFQIVSTQSDGRFVRLAGMAPIDQAAGTWRITMGASPGKGSAMICASGQPALSRCAFGQDGHFSVTPAGDGSWQVEFSGTFLQGGKATEAHGKFRVRETPGDPKHPLFCG